MTLRYVNSWKYFNAETGKEIPEEEIDSYEGACDVEADDYTQKTYTVVAENSGAFRDELPVLWIAAVCAWKRYVYQRYRDKRCHDI